MEDFAKDFVHYYLPSIGIAIGLFGMTFGSNGSVYYFQGRKREPYQTRFDFTRNGDVKLKR